MTDDVKALVERLNNFCIDWDGSIMEREESPMDGLRCGDVLDAANTLTAQADEIERLRGIVRLFTGAAYPVAPEINERGHNWSEAYLDQALKAAQEVKV